MRKSLNLMLAAGLAASAFSTVAAQQAAACGSEEAPAVTKKQPYTEDYSGNAITTPNPAGRLVASVAASTVSLDAGTKADATITIAWSDGLSDYDLEIEDEAGEEIAYSDEIDSAQEQIVLEGVKGCTIITAKTWQWVGDPTTPVTITIELE